MLEIASVQTGAGSPQLSLELHGPELWTLSTAPSWTGLCLSAGLLCPHVLDVAEKTRTAHRHSPTETHALLSALLSPVRKYALLLGGEADFGSPFSGLIRRQLRYPACFVYICLRAFVCVCVDMFGRRSWRVITRLKILLTKDCGVLLRTQRKVMEWRRVFGPE